MLSLLELEYERITVDLKKKESKTNEIISLNPRGEIPILVDGERIIWDSQAILVYLAKEYGGHNWLPKNPMSMSLIMQWLAVSGQELLYGLARARRMLVLGAPGNFSEAQNWGRSGLELLNNQLEGKNWLAAEHPTIADIACYPYVKLAPEAGLNTLGCKSNILRWLKNIEALDGYVEQGW